MDHWSAISSTTQILSNFFFGFSQLSQPNNVDFKAPQFLHLETFL
jgi:hypothetical protein